MDFGGQPPEADSPMSFFSLKKCSKYLEIFCFAKNVSESAHTIHFYRSLTPSLFFDFFRHTSLYFSFLEDFWVVSLRTSPEADPLTFFPLKKCSKYPENFHFAKNVYKSVHTIHFYRSLASNLCFDFFRHTPSIFHFRRIFRSVRTDPYVRILVMKSLSSFRT